MIMGIWPLQWTLQIRNGVKERTEDARVINKVTKSLARYCATVGHHLWAEWQIKRVALSPNNNTPADCLKRHYKSKKEERLQRQLDAFEEVAGIPADWAGDFSFEVNWVERAKDLQMAAVRDTHNQQTSLLQNTVTHTVKHKQGGAGKECIMHSILSADDLSPEDSNKSDGEELLADPLLPIHRQEETMDWRELEQQDKDIQDVTVLKGVDW